MSSKWGSRVRQQPAILGGEPVFPEPIPLTRPTLQVDDALFDDLRGVFSSGILTNASHVAAFEREAADFLRVDHIVATSSCTAGLMLVFRCLSLTGDVILPSFTFMASGHALVWNGLTPVFADSDLRTYNLDPMSVSTALTVQSRAILATHVFGAPIDVAQIEWVARHRNIPLIIDAAHAFGATYSDGTKIGSKGLAEVFSLSPTKPLSSGEGGLIATGDAGLAKELRTAREYGNAGDYDSILVGLNGRMTEVSGIMGRRNLEHLPQWLDRRQQLVSRYTRRLSGVPGLGFQEILAGATSTYKDFSITVRQEGFGMGRRLLATSLSEENIPTRNYFNPPLHRQKAYSRYSGTRSLPNAESLADESLTLPLYSHMPTEYVDGVCDAVLSAHDYCEEIAGRDSGTMAERVR
jgi:dTDP-4-amino-4,6-dideoxygalactose transaminase